MSADSAVETELEQESGPSSGGSPQQASLIWSTLRRSARTAAPGVGFYLWLRAISWASFVVIMSKHHLAWRALFNVYDSALYRILAEHGYNSNLFTGQSGGGASYAFYPLYPALMRGLSVIPGLDVGRAGALISLLASVATVWGLVELGRWFRDERTGLILAGLWAVAPTGVVEIADYADPLFIALAVWALYALVTRRAWITAGVLTFLSGLTRPTAFALIAALLVAALIAIVRRQDGWRPWVAAAISPIGALAWVLFVGAHFGKLTGYFQMEKVHWDNYIDWGQESWHEVANTLTVQGDGTALVAIFASLTILALPVLLLTQLHQRQPLPWVVFSFGVAFMAVCTARFYSTTARELLPAFPFLMLPLAQSMAKSRSSTVLLSLTILAIAAGWYGWYVAMFTGAMP